MKPPLRMLITTVLIGVAVWGLSVPALRLARLALTGIACGVDELVACHNRRAPTGLVVEYFRDTELRKLAGTGAEPRLTRDYPRRVPGIRCGAPWSARWTGILVCPSNAVYDFYSLSVDGLRLSIDGQRILDNWQPNDWLASGCAGQAELAAGEHELVLEYYTRGHAAALNVCWTGGGIPPSTVIGPPHLRKRRSP